MIEVRNLSYSYNGEKQMRFPDFAVQKSEPCLLLGESGSGKTTLLHLAGGLLRGRHGQILIHDQDIIKLSESALDHFRGAHIGFIFQKNHLISALTVKKNLLLASFLADAKQDEKRIHDVLDQLGLSSKMNAAVKELSHGQAQRVAIARAVLNRPDVILADEPTSALDDSNCDRVITLLLEIAAQNNAALLVATHDQRLKTRIPKQINLQPSA